MEGKIGNTKITLSGNRTMKLKFYLRNKTVCIIDIEDGITNNSFSNNFTVNLFGGSLREIIKNNLPIKVTNDNLNIEFKGGDVTKLEILDDCGVILKTVYPDSEQN